MKEQILKLLRRLPQPTPEQKAMYYTGDYAASADLIVTMVEEIKTGKFSSGWYVGNPDNYIFERLISDHNWTDKAASKLQKLIKQLA